MMGTSANFGNMLSVAVAAIALPFIPLLPIQLLLNDLLYDISQLALPSDRVDVEELHKPHRWDIKFIRKFMLVFGPVSSLFDLAAGAMLLFILHATPEMFRTGVFVESLLTQSFILFSIRTSKVPFLRSKASRLLVLSMFIIISIGLLLPASPIARLFQFVVLPAPFYLLLIGIILCYFLVVEWLKKWFYQTIHERMGQDFVNAPKPIIQ
jgi:Mg2+-importing ATPase